MTKMSDLPKDLVEEVISRVPLTSLRRIRSTCKDWNTFSKSKSFAEKHLLCQARDASSSKVVMIMDSRVCLMSINLHDSLESCIKREAKLISLNDSDSDEEVVDVSKVFHCDGLLLCVMKGNTRLVVWNPYWGQTRFIEPTHSFYWSSDSHMHALGYDRSSSSHKILRFCEFWPPPFAEFQIYNFSSDSWRVFDQTLDWKVYYYDYNVSLKGNTYWFAEPRSQQEYGFFLVCFDFTEERFGPRLPLPVGHYGEGEMSLSIVREEQLAFLFQHWSTLEMKIWITTKIEPDVVSWNTKVFLAVNLRPLPRFDIDLLSSAASFLIDEEKKIVVVFDIEKDMDITRNVAFIFGVDGSVRKAYLGDKQYSPLVCSYVPSLVQLN